MVRESKGKVRTGRRSSTLGRALGLMAFMPIASRAPLYARLMLALLVDERTPAARKVLLAGAAGYLLVGRDLIPDDIPVLGGLDTLVFVDGPRDLVLVRSDAVLAACATLGGAWGALASVARVLPRDARDAGYRLIARLRHRTTAGRACPAIPTEWLDRLLG